MSNQPDLPGASGASAEPVTITDASALHLLRSVADLTEEPPAVLAAWILMLQLARLHDTRSGLLQSFVMGTMEFRDEAHRARVHERFRQWMLRQTKNPRRAGGSRNPQRKRRPWE